MQLKSKFDIGHGYMNSKSVPECVCAVFQHSVIYHIETIARNILSLILIRESIKMSTLLICQGHTQ